MGGDSTEPQPEPTSSIDRSITEQREMAVKKLSVESRTVIEVLVRDLAEMAQDLRSAKRSTRWVDRMATGALGLSFGSFFAGVAGLHNGQAPFALRVLFFAAAAFLFVFSIVLYGIDFKQGNDPAEVCGQVLNRMVELDLVSATAMEIAETNGKLVMRERFAKWILRY